jgi:hypothetical protein
MTQVLGGFWAMFVSGFSKGKRVAVAATAGYAITAIGDFVVGRILSAKKSAH